MKMKRIALWGSSVVLLCFAAAAMSLPKRPVLTPPSWQAVGSPPSGEEWWRTTLSDTEPEVAILRITNSDYQTFAADPKKYVNTNHILSKPAKNVANCSSCIQKKMGSATGNWTVIISHTPNSTITFMAAQQ